MKFNEIFLTAFIIILSTALFVWMTSDTGADIQSTASNATISEYVAIGLSGNLSASGITFGSVNPNTNNNNATGNNNSLGQNSSYYITVSTDSNVAGVDFCIRDDYALNNSGNTPIPNVNYHWADKPNATANATDPRMPGTDMLTGYQKTNTTNIAPGQTDYYRFYLNVPLAQAAATYSNTVYFEGVKNTNPC